jgi:hypothetical protein
MDMLARPFSFCQFAEEVFGFCAQRRDVLGCRRFADDDLQRAMVDRSCPEQGTVEVKFCYPFAVGSEFPSRDLQGALLHCVNFNRLRRSVGEITLLGKNEGIYGSKKIIEGTGNIGILTLGEASSLPIVPA